MNSWYWTTTNDERPIRHLIIARDGERLATACAATVVHVDADPDIPPCPDCIGRLMDAEAEGMEI